MQNGVAIPMVQGIVILDREGKRIAAKYYNMDLKDIAAENALEKQLFKKTNKTQARVDADMLSMDQFTAVFKMRVDVIMYVLSSNTENELISLSVLHTLEESLLTLLRHQVSKRTLVENLDLTLLAIDEIIDEGFILEDDPHLVAQRVSMNSSQDDRNDILAQTLPQALQSAKDQFFR